MSSKYIVRIVDKKKKQKPKGPNDKTGKIVTIYKIKWDDGSESWEKLESLTAIYDRLVEFEMQRDRQRREQWLMGEPIHKKKVFRMSTTKIKPNIHNSVVKTKTDNSNNKQIESCHSKTNKRHRHISHSLDKKQQMSDKQLVVINEPEQNNKKYQGCSGSVQILNDQAVESQIISITANEARNNCLTERDYLSPIIVEYPILTHSQLPFEITKKITNKRLAENSSLNGNNSQQQSPFYTENAEIYISPSENNEHLHLYAPSTQVKSILDWKWENGHCLLYIQWQKEPNSRNNCSWISRQTIRLLQPDKLKQYFEELQTNLNSWASNELSESIQQKSRRQGKQICQSFEDESAERGIRSS